MDEFIAYFRVSSSEVSVSMNKYRTSKAEVLLPSNDTGSATIGMDSEAHVHQRQL